LMKQARFVKHYLLASDFDQTLSFNDSGVILSELLGTSGFREKVAGLSHIHLVQQGGELAYLLLHDPEYRRVRREHLVETGKRIRLKQNIRLLPQLLEGLEGLRFSFYVISAAPEEVIQSALEGIVPPDHILWHAVPVRPLIGRDSVHCAGSGRVRQGRRAGGTAVPVGDHHQPACVRGGRHLGHTRDAACQPPRWTYYRRIGSEIRGPHRPAYGSKRRRSERAGAYPGRDWGLGRRPDSRAVRGLCFAVQEWNKVRTDSVTIRETAAAAGAAAME
jgi:hypothetical protein